MKWTKRRCRSRVLDESCFVLETVTRSCSRNWRRDTLRVPVHSARTISNTAGFNPVFLDACESLVKYTDLHLIDCTTVFHKGDIYHCGNRALDGCHCSSSQGESLRSQIS